MQLHYRLLVILFGFFAILSPVCAQDFYWTSSSARSLGMGGAYVASSNDVLDSLSTNPAGLTVLRGRNLNLAADAVFARGSFSNSVNSDSPMSSTNGVLPYGAFGMPIAHSRFSFGVGMVPELLSASNWHYADAPGTAGATYGTGTQNSSIDALRFVAGVGFAVNSKLALGVTVGAVYNTNSLNAPYIFQTQPQLAGLKTLLDLHTSGVGWNGSVGVLAHPSKKFELGVAWKSRTVIDSTGHGSGDAYAQFQALGVNASSTFLYNAMVQNVLPQSVVASGAWQVNPRWKLAMQGDWVNWKNSFTNLPVALSNGNNAVINSIVGGTSLFDAVPLHWKDQYTVHAGVEHRILESTVVRAGFAHASSPVPNSTLTPLTGAIVSNEISGGLGYEKGRSRYDFAYIFRPESNQNVGQSSLQAGEYNNSTLHVGTQSVVFTYSLQF
jgi:long-chain fatty acid transport protein